MPTLTVTKNYSDDAALTEEMLDDAFESIETFLNTTGLNSSNIQTGGLSAANLASSSVTEPKIATSAVTTNKIADLNITLAKLAAEITAKLLPPGLISGYIDETAPTGWLLCDGAAVSRTTYAALFEKIGVTHGQGDNSTTFNVPDYRGRFLRGFDDGAGRDPDAASRTAMNTGGLTGDNIGTLQTGEFASHNHGGGVHSHGLTYSSSSTDTDGGNVVSGNAGSQTVNITVNNSATIINTQGGNETRPLNATVCYIIKT